tara:strand:- start:1875 stop:2717 length:843 start_codon:yes stop_codon:yes gene_type:complete
METEEVSLVLSSGGARGLTQVGVIEEISKDNKKIVEISGSSIGSLVAAFYAAGKLDVFKKWIVGLDRMKVFSFMDFTVSGQGLLKGDKAFKYLKSIIPDQKIENLKIPISIIVTDVINNKEVVIRKGSMYEAIRASCSIPGLVKPYVRDKTEYVDGGVINPLPINRLKNKKKIITVNLNAPPVSELKNKKGIKSGFYNYFFSFKDFFLNKEAHQNLGFYDITYRSIHMMQNELSKSQIKKHKTFKNIEIPCNMCYPLEFYRAGEMIKLGRKFYKKTKNNY